MYRIIQRNGAAALLLAAVLLLCASGTMRAQSLDDLIEQLGIQELARDYLRPGVDAIGYTVNSGYAHTARVDSGFHVWAGAKVITTFIPAGDGTFVAKLPGTLTSLGYPAEVTTATILGGSGAVLRSTDAAQPDVALPDGTGLQRTFFVLPQVSFGPLLGTDIILRGLPPVTYDPEIGKVSFFGAALKHELTHFIDLPFSLALLGGYQQFEITDVIDGRSLSGQLLASTTFGIVTLFGSVGYESYDIAVAYRYTPADPSQESTRVSLDFRRRNLRLTAGGALTLFELLDLTAGYSFGEMDNLSIGLGLTL